MSGSSLTEIRRTTAHATPTRTQRKTDGNQSVDGLVAAASLRHLAPLSGAKRTGLCFQH